RRRIEISSIAYCGSWLYESKPIGPVKNVISISRFVRKRSTSGCKRQSKLTPSIPKTQKRLWRRRLVAAISRSLEFFQQQKGADKSAHSKATLQEIIFPARRL